MSAFSAMTLEAALQHAADVLEPRWERGDQAAATVRNTDFGDQLATADACLSRFLDRELDPGACEPVGGYGKASLGSLLTSKGDELPAEARDAAATGVAIGYASIFLVEPQVGTEFRPDRSPEDVWAYWIDMLRPTAPLAAGVPADFVGRVRVMAADHLGEEFGRLGLRPGVLKRRALTERTGLLGISGMTLRLAQTDAVSDSELEEARR